jgi:hypothetical protein
MNIFSRFNHFTFILYLVLDNYFIRTLLYYLNLLYNPPYYSHSSYLKQDITEWSHAKIPKNLFLCYKHKNIPSSIIKDLKELNPDWQIKLYDDTESADFIHNHYGVIMYNLFESIKDGPIKADLFRICILHYYGGVYSDIDNIILKPLDEIIQKGCSFGVGASFVPGIVNPAFLYSTKNNKILYECIELYKNVISRDPYSYWGYSIVYNMAFILNQYLEIKNTSSIIELPCYNQKIQFYKEDYSYTAFEFIKCAFNPKYNLLRYVYLFDDNTDKKIITLHNPEYNNHSF